MPLACDLAVQVGAGSKSDDKPEITRVVCCAGAGASAARGAGGG